MGKLGIFEIFFGPAWKEEGRLALAPWMAGSGYDFYLYGPKSDAFLRKKWMDVWPSDYLAGLSGLAQHFHSHGLKFGVALSPFGAQEKFGDGERQALAEKLGLLVGLGIDILGIFFDDMPGGEGLAARQLEVLRVAEKSFSGKILFCPSYYSDDPILDKVFGARPEGYLDEIGRGTPPAIDILWTGPKVISPEISAEHLEGVAKILRRKPFLGDNFFANDGPKNCKFLFVKPLTGRSAAALAASSGWAFNPMNQIEASKLVLVAAARVMVDGGAPEAALAEVICALPEGLGEFLAREGEKFSRVGLAGIPPEEAVRLAPGAGDSPLGREIAAWLKGEFIVGSECLTD